MGGTISDIKNAAVYISRDTEYYYNSFLSRSDEKSFDFLKKGGDLMTIGEMISLFPLSEIFFGQIYEFFNSILNISLQYVYIERLGDIFFAEQQKQGEELIK